MTINTNFEQAQLSLAAYALDLRRGMPGAADTDYTNALRFAGMSQTQAAQFANTYTVVDQYTDPTTGLSATVFQKGTQYVLALRGTEVTDILDYIADAQLLFGGAARAQIVSLYDYVQRLITPAGQLAPQVQDVAPVIDPLTGIVDDPGGIRATAAVASLGYLAGVSGATAAGHSLGGYLAAASSISFSEMSKLAHTFWTSSRSSSASISRITFGAVSASTVTSIDGTHCASAES